MTRSTREELALKVARQLCVEWEDEVHVMKVRVSHVDHLSLPPEVWSTMRRLGLLLRADAGKEEQFRLPDKARG